MALKGVPRSSEFAAPEESLAIVGPIRAGFSRDRWNKDVERLIEMFAEGCLQKTVFFRPFTSNRIRQQQR